MTIEEAQIRLAARDKQSIVERIEMLRSTMATMRPEMNPPYFNDLSAALVACEAVATLLAVQ